MVGVFVRLKGRLLVNGFRGNVPRAISFVFGALIAIVSAGLMAALLGSSRHRPDVGEPITVLAVTALNLAWATFPLLGFGSDETLDPTRLSLLPLTRRQLMTGLLAASMVGIAPTASAIILAGAVIGRAPSGPGALLVVLAAILELALCITLSRAIVTALSAALRSRRGRDLRIILVALVPLIFQLPRIVALPVQGRSTTALRSIGNVAGWLPTGLAGRAMVAANHGHLVVSGLDELAIAGAVLALWWWWSRSLDRIATTAEVSATTRTRAQPASSALPLFGGLWRFLPRTRLGVVAAADLRLSWRDPRRRAQLVSGLALPFILMAGNLTNGGWRHHDIVFLAVVVVWLMSTRAINFIGPDGRAWWIHEAAGSDWAADLAGKCLSEACRTGPFFLLPAVGLAAVSGGWDQLPASVALGVGLLGVVLGVGCVTSVYSPTPVPDTTGNLWGSTSGRGCMAAITSFGALAIEAVLISPIAIAMVLIPSVAGRTAVGALAVIWGWGWGAAGWRVAVRRGRDRGPEILAAIEPSRAA